MFNRTLNSRTMVIVSRGGNVARVSYNPRQPKKVSELLGEVELQGDVAALQMVTFTLEQFAQDMFEGEVSIVTHDDVAIRAFEYKKAVNGGLDKFSALAKDWMDEEYLQSIEAFIEALDNCPADVKFNKLSNVYVWSITVAEGIEVKADDVLEFKDGLALEGAIASQIKLNNKYKVVNYKGELALERPNNSVDAQNVLKAIDYAWSKCPREEIGFEGVVAGDSY
jgi:hypothetical protein